MAAIDNAFAEANSNQATTSSTYQDVTNASIASGAFTAGKKYLIMACASFGSAIMKVRAVHGSTAFDDSEITDLETSPFRMSYQWWTVWTAVASEGIKLQFANSDNTTSVNINFAALLAINLSDSVTENTDWFYASRGNDDGLGTTPVDGASITFTPGSAANDWLVLTHAQVDITSTTVSPISRLVRSGEASSSTPEVRAEGGSTSVIKQFVLSRVFTLGAASNTFKEQGEATSAATHTRLHSQVFALKLNKFRNHAFAYTDADAALSATDYATLAQTVNITPAVISNVMIGATFGFDLQNIGRELEYRVRVDGSDSPAGQTTANYQYGHGQDATDEGPTFFLTRPSLSAAAHTINLDTSADSATASPAIQHRSLWAVTMELAVTAYTLAMDAGVYNLTGTAASILAARKLAMDGGSYAVSGQDATLRTARKLVADPGLYSLSGTVATLLRTALLNAEAGSYALTGQDVSLLLGFRLVAESGSYALSGQDIAMLRDLLLNAESGTYDVSGQVADLLRGLRFNVESGSYAVSGQDAALQLARKLIAESGQYDVTGTDAALQLARKLIAEAGSYALAGTDAALLRDAVLSVAAGAYVITGTDVALVFASVGNYVIVATGGSYAITGTDASLLRDALLSAESGAYAITGEAAEVIAARLIAAEAGSYAVSGEDVSLIAQRRISAEAGQYDVTGMDITLLADRIILLDSGGYLIVGEDATLNASSVPVPTVIYIAGESLSAPAALAGESIRSPELTGESIKSAAIEDEEIL